ncbi:MAG TPA: CBS domain-containing protein, partial [Opitutaceae bacterium]|nr:CBS domain-containing protein [Opitutaceae bacterium]
RPNSAGSPYPPFADQKGWILLNEHLMGQTILDIDGRRTEVVNDVQLLSSKGRMIIVHVDISFNGFLRRWGLERFSSTKDRLISWRFVQPLSVEDHTKDVVTLSVAREQALDLPGEDLADALEVLSGDEQHAMFSALEPDKAAEVLVEAEPRARRQLMAFLGGEKARLVLARLTVPQIADLFANLSYERVTEMMRALPPARAARVHAVMTNPEVLASTLMSDRFLAFTRETRVADVLATLRSTPIDRRNISYIYLVADPDRTLVGLVDLRDLVTAQPETSLGDLMLAPVVTADRDALREDLEESFAKYQFRMLPVVDPHDHLLGVVRYQDLMKDAKLELPA